MNLDDPILPLDPGTEEPRFTAAVLLGACLLAGASAWLATHLLRPRRG